MEQHGCRCGSVMNAVGRKSVGSFLGSVVRPLYYKIVGVITWVDLVISIMLQGSSFSMCSYRLVWKHESFMYIPVSRSLAPVHANVHRIVLIYDDIIKIKVLWYCFKCCVYLWFYFIHGKCFLNSVANLKQLLQIQLYRWQEKKSGKCWSIRFRISRNLK